MILKERKYRDLLILGVLFLVCVKYWDIAAGMLGMALQAAAPLAVGGVIAYIVNILMTFYERHYPVKAGRWNLEKTRRPACLVLALVSFVFIIVFVCGLIIPELANCVGLLFRETPKVVKELTQELQRNPQLKLYAEELNKNVTFDPKDLESILTKGASILGAGLGGAMNTLVSVVSSVFSTIVTLFVAVVFAMYLLAGKERLGSGMNEIVHAYIPKWHQKITYVMGVLNQSFRSYIIGQCTEAVILGALCIVGMWIFRFPYATMTGTLIGFTALIPIAGAYVGGGIGAFMIFTVSPVKAVLFIIFLVVLQQLEGNLIYPRVVGASIGLPGIWVLAAVTVGGGLLGIAGMLLGVPLAAALYQLLRNDVQDRLSGQERRL